MSKQNKLHLLEKKDKIARNVGHFQVLLLQQHKTKNEKKKILFAHFNLKRSQERQRNAMATLPLEPTVAKKMQSLAGARVLHLRKPAKRPCCTFNTTEPDVRCDVRLWSGELIYFHRESAA